MRPDSLPTRSRHITHLLTYLKQGGELVVNVKLTLGSAILSGGSDLLLILFDRDHGSDGDGWVEGELGVHGQDTHLVAEKSPAEMQELVE